MGQSKETYRVVDTFFDTNKKLIHVVFLNKYTKIVLLSAHFLLRVRITFSFKKTICFVL